MWETLVAYGQSKDILALNTHQLRHIVQLLEDPADPAQIRILVNREKLQGLFSSVLQHFHNFLCSTTTLIDHTRHVMGRHFITEAHRLEYGSMVKMEFDAVPLARFMKDFRNYITHYAIPIIGLTDNLGTEPRIIRLNVGLESAIASNFKWSSGAKKFMEQYRPEVRMLTLIDAYEAKARPFHEYFVMAYHRHLKSELSEFLCMKRELANQMKID